MKRLSILISILIILTVGTIAWWKIESSPVDSKNKESQVFVVEKGEGVRSISKKLKEEKLIKNTVLFFLVVKKSGLENKIQAGDHRLSPSMTIEQIAENLTYGTLDVWVTIPEGLRAEEIADILQKEIPSYQESWREELIANEGYLFPDTYLIPKDADISLVLSIMKNNFDAKFKTLDLSNTNLSEQEIVTIASLIEREARLDKDRPLVASVILNRLDIGMGLDLDATLQYALGYDEEEKTWWRKGLTNNDKSINSRYNTYKYAGLPPTPISNPGLSSMMSVANPANTDWLYYVSDKNGVNHYAKTLEEHEMNIEKYLR